MAARLTRRAWLTAAAASIACGLDPLDEPAPQPPRVPQPHPRVAPSLAPATAHPALGSLDDLSATERRLYVDDRAFAPLPEPLPGTWRARFDEPPQTYSDYLASKPNRPDHRNRLYILPLGEFPREMVVEPRYVVLVSSPPLSRLGQYAEAFFGLPTTVMDPRPLEPLSVPARLHRGHEQFHAPKLLDAVRPWLPDDAYAMITVIHRDMYVVPDQDYAFGYGLHRGRLAAMSFAHFDPIFMGRARPEHWRRDIERRSLAVLTHELAHTFGMRHCTAYACVLNGMSHPQELDRTPPHLCPVCLRKLGALGLAEPRARYERLAAFYARADLHDAALWVRRRLAYLRAAAA